MPSLSRPIASRHVVRATLLSAALVMPIAGCKSDYDKQVEQARTAVASTGQAQQIISVDKNGNTTITTVQPAGIPGAAPVLHSTITPAGAPPVLGQPDWSNGARPAPGNTVTFSGPRVAPPAASASAPLPPEGTAPSVQTSGTASSAMAPAPDAKIVFAPTDLTVPAGTGLSIRLNQAISVKHSHAGDHFTGELAEAVSEGGRAVLPRGTRVNGIVTEAHRRGHFKGRSYLGLRLTSIAYQGKTYPITTGSLTRTKKGKGKRSSAFIGTGTGVGMLVGGLATGGVGLAVGGLAGGGLGTLLGGITGNRDIEIAAESLVHFKLEDNLTVQPAE